MSDSTTKKETHVSPVEASSPTYKVWLEIEEYDELTGCGNNCDAPGGALATFDAYEDAYEFAVQVDAEYSNHPASTGATKPFTVVGYWTDNEQGFVEATMARSAEAACESATQEIASRNTVGRVDAESLESLAERIRVVAVFEGRPNCAVLRT